MISSVRSDGGGQASGTTEFAVGASLATHIRDPPEHVAR